MTKITVITAAGLVFAILFAAAPAQAATRNVEIGMDTFASRCVEQGGQFDSAAALLSCQTASVRVDCAFVDQSAAECSWPGIDNRVAVNRLIGMAPSESLSDGDGGVAKKGGFKLPNLPLKWK